MANSWDPARRRLRSLSDVISSARTAATAVRHWLAFLFFGVVRSGHALFPRLFENGFDPPPPTRHFSGRAESIVVRNLSARYGQRYAFENLTVEFAAGSLTAVIGPNGAGKSSLLKVLAGVIRPASGG